MLDLNAAADTTSGEAAQAALNAKARPSFGRSQWPSKKLGRKTRLSHCERSGAHASFHVQKCSHFGGWTLYLTMYILIYVHPFFHMFPIYFGALTMLNMAFCLETWPATRCGKPRSASQELEETPAALELLRGVANLGIDRWVIPTSRCWFFLGGEGLFNRGKGPQKVNGNEEFGIVRPWQIGFGRWVKSLNIWVIFRVELWIYRRVI